MDFDRSSFLTESIWAAKETFGAIRMDQLGEMGFSVYQSTLETIKRFQDADK